MPTSSRYTLDTRVLDGIIKNLDGNVTNAVAKAAFAVEARAKQKAPVDTGALRASIYVSMKRGSNGNEAMSAARARRPEAGIEALPVPRDNYTAYVGPSVEYGREVEMGGAYMAGRPYLRPALRETERELRELLGKAVSNK